MSLHLEEAIILLLASTIKHELQMRIRVVEPPGDVTMKVQRGRDELLSPVKSTAKELVFEFPISVDISSGQPNFLGKYSQGPKDVRFVYVNSGTYAGQNPTCWSRRAKVSLMSITLDQVDQALATGGTLETTFPGTGRDGGPTCASVKGIVWQVVKK
jgi:hypothetical protein